ncbi:MAG: hypothetical protein Q4E18_14815, partial [Clostridia bacterium]|nr:hypothetical protein [Clostridia bacterium]
KAFLHSLRCDLSRALSGIGFFAAMLAVVVIQMQAVLEDLLMPGGDIIYYLDLTLGTGYMQILMPAVGTLCYSRVLQRDRESGYMIYEKYRVTRGVYDFSKITACFVGAWLSVVTGMLLFIGVLALKVPMVSDAALVNMDAYQTGLFGRLLAEQKYLLYVLCVVCVRGLIAGAWSLVGMAASTVSQERAIAYAAPFLISYGIQILCSAAGITLTPGKLDCGRTGGYTSMQNPLEGFLGVFAVVGCLSAAAILFIRRMEKRRS